MVEVFAVQGTSVYISSVYIEGGGGGMKREGKGGEVTVKGGLTA